MNPVCQQDPAEPLAPRRPFPLALIYVLYQLAATAVLVAGVGPWFRDLYTAVDVPVPVLTVAAFDLSDRSRDLWFAWPFVVFFAGRWVRKRGFDQGFALTATVIIAAFWLVYLIGVLMPFLPGIDPP